MTISASNAGGTGSAILTVSITEARPVITSGLTAAGQQGAAFSYGITASNSPTAFAAAGLPPGLSVNPGTGLITGTPTISGTFPVTISASNAGGTASAVLTVSVVLARPVITSAAIAETSASRRGSTTRSARPSG